MPLNMTHIPSHIIKLLRDSGCDDGDVWMLGNGCKAEYSRGHFTITENGKVIERVSFKELMQR